MTGNRNSPSPYGRKWEGLWRFEPLTSLRDYSLVLVSSESEVDEG